MNGRTLEIILKLTGIRKGEVITDTKNCMNGYLIFTNKGVYQLDKDLTIGKKIQ